MKDIEVINYAVDLIDPSPYQVRKKFDPEALAELAGSIREDGIIQPLTARCSPTDPARLELVAGERRLRAAKLAELTTVPVIVHEMSDRRAQRIVLIENLQREDLTVSEEAQGYQKALSLLDEEGKPVYTQASLAQEINKPLNHVRDRLKLLMCPPDLIAAVEEGTVSLSTSMLVGRVPDAKARANVAMLVLKPDIQEVPLNYKQTQELIREKFMVSLQKPGFDVEDADLLPVVMSDTGERLMGGSCVGCPFVAGSLTDDPSRNSATGKGGTKAVRDCDLCTLPACHRKKQDLAWKIVAQTAEEQNVRVIQGDAARKLFSGYRGGLVHDADYVQLDEKPEYDEIGQLAYQNKKNWKQLLKGVETDVVIARHPVTGQRVELVEKKQAALIVKAKLKGTDEKVEIANAEQAESVRKEQRAKEIREQKIEALVVNEGLTDLVEAIHRKGMDQDNLDYLFQMALGQSGADGMRSMRLWLDVKMPKGTVRSEHDYEEEILKAVKARATGANGWLGFITAAILCKHIKYSGSDGEDFMELKKRYGIKDVELKRRAAAILDAGKKPKRVETPAPETGDLETDTSDLADRADTTPPVDENREGMKQLCREWKAANPGHGVAAVADGLMIPYEVAAQLCDELIDEKATAEMTFEEQVGALIVGTHKMADLIGKTPKRDAPERKAWDAKRVKLTKAVAKAQAEMAAAEKAEPKPAAKVAKKPAKKAA